MESSRITQSLTELNFVLYHRPLHPELFDIYRSQQFFQGDYEVNLWLTGCSHVLSVFYDGECMTELICQPDQMLPRRGLIERLAFRGEKKHQCDWAGGCRYMMNLQVETMSPNLYSQTHADLIKLAKKRGIYVPFPQWTKNSFVPFSYVDYEARWDELQLHTYHAFPEQQTIIKTQSLFNMKR